MPATTIARSSSRFAISRFSISRFSTALHTRVFHSTWTGWVAAGVAVCLAGCGRAGEQRAAEGARLAAQLRGGLARLDPRSEQARQVLVLLGSIEEARGDYGAAAAAWGAALNARFEPTLAVQAAEAASRAEGRVSEASAALFRRALQEAPADAPWRSFVQARLAEAG